MVFQHGGQAASHGQPRPVEGMRYQALFAILQSQVHAPGLELAHVRTRRNFSVALLAGHPDLQVERVLRCKTKVAGTQLHDSVRHFQGVQRHARPTQNILEEGLFRALRVFDTHQLDLVELVLPYKPGRIPAAGAGLPPEAGCVGHPGQGQVGRCERLVRHQVGDRHFGGGDEVQVILGFEQVVGEFGELAGPKQRLASDQVRNVDLFVARRAVEIEHHLNEGAVQRGDRAT